jgi:hypothetical protein
MLSNMQISKHLINLFARDKYKKTGAGRCKDSELEDAEKEIRTQHITFTSSSNSDMPSTSTPNKKRAYEGTDVSIASFERELESLKVSIPAVLHTGLFLLSG